MGYDYRAQAYHMAGRGNEKAVDAAAAELHYNESLHMHNLGDEKTEHGACSYCWLRAGRAVHALGVSGWLGNTQDVETPAVTG